MRFFKKLLVLSLGLILVLGMTLTGFAEIGEKTFLKSEFGQFDTSLSLSNIVARGEDVEIDGISTPVYFCKSPAELVVESNTDVSNVYINKIKLEDLERGLAGEEIQLEFIYLDGKVSIIDELTFEILEGVIEATSSPLLQLVKAIVVIRAII